MTKKSKRYKDGWHPFKKGADAKKSSERPPIPDGLNAEEFWDRCQDDRRYYFEHCLRIRVKIDGKNLMVPLVLNREQGMILDSIEEQEKLGVPIRIIILKSRKVGCSTLIEALGHHLCQFNEHAIAKCVAHRKESTEDIFEITHRYQENMHWAINEISTGKSKRSSRDMGVFWEHGSRFEVQTQGATDADRGDTPDFLHLSELGLWWKRRKTTSDEDVLQSALGSIADVKGTYVIIESTACGAAGAFYSRFWRAWKNEPGNMFKALFFGWQQHEKYRLPKQKGDDIRHRELVRSYNANDPESFWKQAKKLGYDERWAQRAIEHKLQPNQVRWAIRALQTKFNGDIKRFDTEFPLSPEVAFTSSSQSPIDQDEVRKRLMALEDLEIELKTYQHLIYNKRTKECVWEHGLARWKVWHEPQHGHDYLITVDSCHGTEEGDFACIQVLDRTDRVQCAEFYFRAAPDDTAKEAYAAGMYYNEALLAPEVDGPGLATLQNLLDLDGGSGYPNLYVRSTSGNWSQRFGFRMGSKARRDACVAAISKAVRQKTWDFYSTTLLHECQTFIEKSTGKCEAMPGEHDDAVISMAIGLYLDQELGEVDIVEERAPVERHTNKRIAKMLDKLGSRNRHLGGL
tara:strand:+ start:1580 stop:3466 length:1887 start_codon:yes stop_codon:yes gene_type:complete